MKNLRIVDSKVTSFTIELFFNEQVTQSLTIDNFSIISESIGTPEVIINSIDIVEKKITLNTRPLTYNSLYKIVLKSTPTNAFISRDGNYSILEDGVINSIRLLGPPDIDNPVFNYYKTFFKDNIYDIDSNDTFISKYLKGSSQELVKCFNETNQIKSDRFLSFDVVDELKVRGPSSFDRLNSEGAYLVKRVGLSPSSTVLSSTIQIDKFESQVICLSEKQITKDISTSESNFFNLFDKNNLILNLDKNLIKITSLKFVFLNSDPNYTYDLFKLGYQLLNSKYDDNSFSNLTLTSSQAKLSDSVLQDARFDLNNLFKIQIVYYVNDFGKNIDSTSINVFDIKKAIREVCPSIINVFDLKHKNIRDSLGDQVILGGLEILNTQTFKNDHPSFKNEIKFDLQSLPSKNGDFCVDYLLGKVYVFGYEDANGTGDFPPVISYYYKYDFVSEIDYVFDDQAINKSSLNDFVALPYGSLINNSAKISYSYDYSLSEGVDYNSNTHIEVLNERIENNFKYPNIFISKNGPITGVFRIYNETSGEIYQSSRFNSNKIYAAGNKSPSLGIVRNEKIDFSEANETLIVSDSINYTSTVYKIFLQNINIISKTQSGIGYNKNTSVVFSNNNVFLKEKYFSLQQIQNLLIGEYTIDYFNGIIYVGVDSQQNYNIGNVQYKYGFIKTQQKHITNVFDIIKKSSIINSNIKSFDYKAIKDSQVELEKIETQLTSQINSTPILNINGLLTVDQSTRLFSDYQINKVLEYSDLINNTYPVEFNYTYVDKQISVLSNSILIDDQVKFDGSQFYIDTNIKSDYINSNFTYNVLVNRYSDGFNIFSSFAIINDQYRVYLTTGTINEYVKINFTIIPNNLTRFCVDFSDGDLFIDYEYLKDEIIISYEYGDNVIDFRESSVEPGTEYYVTYKAGALREGLVNFASLLRVPELQTFDTEYDRENFRDAVIGGLSSFLLGATSEALTRLVNAITHINPEIKETLFDQWILGDSFLHSGKLNLKSSLSKKTKYELAPVFSSTNDYLQLPFSSNVNLTEGTFSAWFKPDFDIVDNSAEITLSIKKDGVFVKSNLIFIGAQEYHPTDDGEITLSKSNIIVGVPQFNKLGYFIYIDKKDGIEKWVINVPFGTITSETLLINVKTSKQKIYAIERNTSFETNLTTKQNSFVYKITAPNSSKEIAFISSEDKFIFDTNSENKNRMRLYFDSFGYLTFKVYDKNKKSASMSYDCSDWKTNDLHHIGVGWKLNTTNNSDELHMFIDGKEVPNCNYWGENYDSILENVFRSKHLDRFVGSFVKDIVGSNDLEITINSDIVASSINFGSYNISPGDIIHINESGFDENGYTIIAITGQQLQLSSLMPMSLNDASFSVNQASITLKSKDWLYPNLAVFKASPKFTDFGHVYNKKITIPSSSYLNINIGDLILVNNQALEVTYVGVNYVNVSKETTNGFSIPFIVYDPILVELKNSRAVNPEYFIKNDVLNITNNLLTNELLFISTLGINSERVNSTYYSWTNDIENIIKTTLPTPINLDGVSIKLQLANLVLNSSNSSIGLSSSYNHSSSFSDSNCSVSAFGRSLDIILTGLSNTTFTNPTIVSIQGDTISGLTTETFYFSSFSKQTTNNLFLNIKNIQIDGYFVNQNKSFCSLIVNEALSVLEPEDSSENVYPVLKYSYVIKDGFNLSSDGYTFTDNSLLFSKIDINNYLYINQPLLASGIFEISSVLDTHNIELTDGPNFIFNDGYYQVLRTTGDKTGFQNGYFTFQQKELTGQKYFLSKGNYIFDYYTKLNLDYLSNDFIVIGNSFDKTKPLHGSLDQIKIENILLKDVRVGEISSDKNITAEFNSLKPLTPTSSTLFFLQNGKNTSFYYDRNKNKKMFYTNHHINSNFGDSIYLQKPLQIENKGIFDNKQGTISFWASLSNDSIHENRKVTLLDISSVTRDTVETIDKRTLSLDYKVSKVLKVSTQSSNKDYFLNGLINISLDDCISEEIFVISGNSSLKVSRPVQQVVSIKKKNLFSNKDYFGSNGSVSTDGQTIYFGVVPNSTGNYIVTYKPLGIDKNLNKQVIKLGQNLPSDKMIVNVDYLPENTKGDNLSLFKDEYGNLIFRVIADKKETSIITPINWKAGNWHKIKLSYSMNNLNTDTISMWVDGYQYSNTFDYNTNYINSPYDGYVSPKFGNVINYNNISKNINFQDIPSTITFGSNANLTSKAIFAIDDIKFTNKYTDGYNILGEKYDLAYSSNLESVIPSTEDLYTTFILSGNTEKIKTDNFSYLRNKGSVNNDFYLNIFDSFDIVKSNDRVKLILEKLIKLIKPASSKVYIRYIG